MKPTYTAFTDEHTPEEKAPESAITLVLKKLPHHYFDDDPGLFGISRDLDDGIKLSAFDSRLQQVYCLMTQKNPRWYAALEILQNIVQEPRLHLLRTKKQKHDKLNFVRLVYAICCMRIASYYDLNGGPHETVKEYQQQAIKFLKPLEFYFQRPDGIKSLTPHQCWQLLGFFDARQFAQMLLASPMLRSKACHNIVINHWAILAMQMSGYFDYKHADGVINFHEYLELAQIILLSREPLKLEDFAPGHTLQTRISLDAVKALYELGERLNPQIEQTMAYIDAMAKQQRTLILTAQYVHQISRHAYKIYIDARSGPRP